MNSLFDLPTMGNLGRQAQLFSGWTPALDLYQNNDNVVAVVELPGMRKEDIEISLHDGMLTIAGERKSSAGEGENAERTERFSRQIPPQHHPADASRCGQSQRLLQRWHSDRDPAESRGSEAEENRSQHRIIVGLIANQFKKGKTYEHI